MTKRPLSLKLIVLYKVTLGLVEVLFGFTFAAVALGVQQAAASRIIQHLIAKELSEDPNDFLVRWVLTHNVPEVLHAVLGPSLVVLALGLVKLFIAYAVWQNSRRTHAIALALVAALGVAGAVSTVHAFSWFKVVATGVDVLLLYYLAWVLPRHYPLDAGAPTR